MPIKNLTDRPAQFPRIGILRKGSVKQERGGRQIYGKDLEGFRFDTEDADALTVFTAAYGDEPRQINVFLPYATTGENFQAWKELWTASALQHRCDGETCVRWLDRKSGKYQETPTPCPGGCKEVGRLMVIIPELRRMAYVQAETHSINDIVELQQNLMALEQGRGTLRGIPMILSRRPRNISTPRDNGQRARVVKWLLHIEAAPRWVDLQLADMEQRTLEAPAQSLPQLALSATTVQSSECEQHLVELNILRAVAKYCGALVIALPEPATASSIRQVIELQQAENEKQLAAAQALESPDDVIIDGDTGEIIE